MSFANEEAGIGRPPVRLRIYNPHSFVMLQHFPHPQPQPWLTSWKKLLFLSRALHRMCAGSLKVLCCLSLSTLAALFPFQEVGSTWLKTVGEHLHQGLNSGVSGSQPWCFYSSSSSWELIPREDSGGASSYGEWMNEKSKSCYINLVVHSYHPLVVWGEGEVRSGLWFDFSSKAKGLQIGIYISSSRLGPWSCISFGVDSASSNC